MSLVEVMIAMAILSVAVIGLIGGFLGMQKAVQGSKTKSLASNLAQEQMQILSQLSYYQVLTTPAPNFLTTYTPNIAYDPTYFPPQTILQGGITYTWYTYVQVAMENNDAIVVMAPSTPDTGMKLVTITVTWTQSGVQKMASVSSVISNPNTVMTNCQLTGTFTNSLSGKPISGGAATIAENLGWRDTTSSSGTYNINASPGSYLLVAQANGYFSQFVTVSIAQNQTLTTNFSLVPIATGTVAGTAWVNPALVISQVVGTTNTCTGTPCTGANVNNVEYVELFNPTSTQINIVTPPAATASPWNSSTVTENYKINTNVGGTPYSNIMGCAGSGCVYVSSYVASGHYYLLANYPTIFVNGAWVTSDAYFENGCGGPPADCIANDSWGGILLETNPFNNAVDHVCWSGNGGNPTASFCNGTFVPVDTSCGLEVGGNSGLGAHCTSGTTVYPGNQLVRYSLSYSTGGWIGRNHGVGSAYGTGYNDVDFSSPSATGNSNIGLNFTPYTTASSSLNVVSGLLPVGAFISANDGLSSPVQATSPGDVVGASATFNLTDIASGTWSFFISSSGYLLENDTVTVYATANSTACYTFPSSSTFLSTGDVVGFVAGYVTDINDNPISGPAITVSAGGKTSQASTVNGRYFLRVSTGSVDVFANSSSPNSSYVSLSSLAVTVSLGEVHDGVNFMLSQGGQITGYVTRDGTNALPGIAVTAIDANGFARDTEITNAQGSFTTIIVATGTYYMTPELGVNQVASPSTSAVTVASGLVVFSTTFTISNAMGVITGTATASGQAISTGVLIVVTTSTLSSGPPTISSASLTSGTIYVGSCLEDGSFSISVAQSTSPSYNLYGYYTIVSSTGGVVFEPTQSVIGIPVLAGQTVSGKHLAW